MMLYRHYRLLPLLALSFAIWMPSLATAQGNEPVWPLLNVLGSGKNRAVGLTPAQIKRAYGFDRIQNQGEKQTIAIVDAFDHPNIVNDLKTFDQQFGLPDLDCTNGDGCFQKVCLWRGGCTTNPGASDPNYSMWALEIAIDVEWAHAIAPKANIVLVEVFGGPTGTNSCVPQSNLCLDVLLDGVDVAVNMGASVVSMSWGGVEFSTENGDEDLPHFMNRPNVTFFAAAGDFGHGTEYPAASPYVMSVGGTKLNLDQAGNYVSEKAWSGTGGGFSPYEPEPQYQLPYIIPSSDPLQMRGTPDVAYDGDPNTGVAVFDSVPFGRDTGWFQMGGTSIGAPQWSALVAIANSLRVNEDGKLPLTGTTNTGGTVIQAVLYDAVQDSVGNITFHDVSDGKDGNCGTQCHALPGYDFLTGLGTPRADLLIPALRHLQ